MKKAALTLSLSKGERKAFSNGLLSPLCPDATFEIADNRTDLTAPMFLETDNSTVPLTRSSFDGSSFLKKCVAYWHHWDRPRS